ncbi:MAG TPA: hypothetical protein VGD38_21905 [Pyrinomonadaceae bacterium]
MRPIYLVSVLVTCLGCTILKVVGHPPEPASLRSELQLKTEVVGATFCESDYLRLQLRLRYFNSGKQAVILSRYSNTIWTYFISKTFKDAQRKKYEQEYSPTQSLIGESAPVDTEEPNAQEFVILSPGGSYEVTAQAHLPFLHDGKDDDPSLLRPGTHVLEIRAGTWPGKQDVATKLRERWRAHGYLWTESIMSQPMTFTIAESPQVVKCSD